MTTATITATMTATMKTWKRALALVEAACFLSSADGGSARGGGGGSGRAAKGSYGTCHRRGHAIGRGEALLFIADVNQPRARDYTPEERAAIAAAREQRGSLLDDGVAALLSARGFRCVFDRPFDGARSTSGGIRSGKGGDAGGGGEGCEKSVAHGAQSTGS